ncbi:MAG: TIGR03960 family B12-binding radical SAM protein [Microthrixaceae bacterium]
MAVPSEPIFDRLEPLLNRVQRPARYIGCEVGAVEPDWDKAADPLVAWLLAYPDTYEIGQPNQGLQILFEILNERPDAVAERTYAPWTDLEAEMRAADVPLFSIDTHRSASAFDLLAFNLSAELTFTNLLNMVDLAGVPVRAAERDETHPLVLAGGHCTYNPEPLADFLDLVVLGDGEEPVGEITELVAEWTGERRAAAAGRGGDEVAGDGDVADAPDREALLRRLATVEGVYVPAAYEVSYAPAAKGVEGSSVSVVDSVGPIWPEAPEIVPKRTIADLAEWPYPRSQMVPLTEVVHDRLNVEVFRGCTRGCRFCQAGMVTRPVRERPAEQVAQMVTEGLARTGYDEVALTSLSTADFSGISDVVGGIVDADTEGRLSVSLPSLRVDAFGVDIAAQVQKGRRTGLTFAPEAGTWRMRQVINKLVREEDLYNAVDSAYSQGWRRVKLYFLTGLPTETDEDTLGIARLAENCVTIGRRHLKNPSVTVSVGGFVPKPFTPFQWFGQNTEEELHRKIGLLRDALRKNRNVAFKWHDSRASVVEGAISRGDRRVGAVIEAAWRAGAVFQEWSECFSLDLWRDAFTEAGLSIEEFAYRHREELETLPWEHLDAGLHKDFLYQEWQDALEEVGLEDCRWTPCYDCGACTGWGVEHVVASAVPPAGGSQGTGQDLDTGGLLPEVVAVPVELGVPS